MFSSPFSLEASRKHKYFLLRVRTKWVEKLHVLSFLGCFFDRTNHVESLFWKVIKVTIQNTAKTTDGVFQRHILTS